MNEGECFEFKKILDSDWLVLIVLVANAGFEFYF